ncbi:MAG: hypothetical protein KC646_13775 [Candidatus Cloacimonetes bacterium]|nr:hypothetical protein [Candidatus Cloacimonadota bacterium]
MKCYYHNELDGIAMCGWCSRALCTSCATEVMHGLACKDKCETSLKEAYELNEFSKEMVRKAMKSSNINVQTLSTVSYIYYSYFVAGIISGSGFLYVGIRDYLDTNDSSYLMFAGLGLFLFLMGCVFFWIASRHSIESKSLESIKEE